MNRAYENQVVWIIGASSGIGAALAQELYAQGATLALSARRQDELDKLNNRLGNSSKTFALDVTDVKMMMYTVQAIYECFGRIDRVIFLAAAYVPMKISELDIAVTRNIIDTNLSGAFNVVHAVLPLLTSQPKQAQLALCGSVAGYVGLPGGQPYSATKAAIINLAESLHAECKGKVDIKLISPGFVSTPLTDKNNFAMPMIIQPQEAAKEIAKGLLSSRFEVHFPKRFTFLLKCLRLLPYGISLPLTRQINLEKK